MGSARKIYAWIHKNLLLLIIAFTVLIYLRWFWLTPLVFKYYNDPNAGFLVGIVLFIALLIFIAIYRCVKDLSLKFATLTLIALLSLINIWHIVAFFPKIENRVICDGRTYYITWMHPLGDYQWTFDQLTVWDGLQYESQFFGYLQDPFEIICDDERGAANIIRTINGVLTYSHGMKKVSYYDWAGTQLGQNRYFLAWQCDEWGINTCDLETYTLHECTLEYKSCDPLLISYTDTSADILVLEADKISNEIRLYDDYDYNLERILIFTYGENPRCYVEGCQILEP